MRSENRVVTWAGTVLPLAAAVLLLAGTQAEAQQKRAELKLEMQAWQEVMIEKDGEVVSSRVPAGETGSGDVLIYTIAYTNTGDVDARNASLVGPVPAETEFVSGSVQSEAAQVLYSIDGGDTYHKPPIQYSVKNPDGTLDRKKAPPEMYTHVRWVLTRPVRPGGKGEVSYKVKVK